MFFSAQSISIVGAGDIFLPSCNKKLTVSIVQNSSWKRASPVKFTPTDSLIYERDVVNNRCDTEIISALFPLLPQSARGVNP
jgi:hypothetical protein